MSILDLQAGGFEARRRAGGFTQILLLRYTTMTHAPAVFCVPLLPHRALSERAEVGTWSVSRMPSLSAIIEPVTLPAQQS
jgi:hypothetical protein